MKILNKKLLVGQGVGAKSGAEYLDQIINIKQNNFDKEPWEKMNYKKNSLLN